MGAGAPQPRRSRYRRRAALAEVERYGVERLLDELAAELKEEPRYRVKPSRRVWIPKPGRCGATPALDSFGS